VLVDEKRNIKIQKPIEGRAKNQERNMSFLLLLGGFVLVFVLLSFLKGCLDR